MYVFVRRDLRHPQQIVQACHAAYEAGKLLISDPTHLDELHLVAISVSNESKLRKAAAHLDELGIRYRAFVEPDLNNEMTALATEPVPEDRCHLLRKYQCVKCQCQPGGVQS